MPMQAVSLFDTRSFFEKALAYGVQHGLLTPQKLDAMCQEAPKGMVQIARYFGTEFLRPELERAKDRMVNLISLHLEATTRGDLQQAAELLRDNSLLSRSKAGSDMLKALIAMPQNSHFGMHEPGGFQDTQIPVLAKWTLQSLPQYQSELAKRNTVQLLVDAALWMAEQLGMDEEALQESNADAEAVIRTALIALAGKRTEMPDWVDFAKLIANASKKVATASANAVIPLPKEIPQQLLATLEAVRRSVLGDLPKIAESTVPARKLFDQTPAFMGRYFWLENGLAEVDHYHRQVSATWDKATGGRHDDSTLLTLFLTLAAGSTQKTLLTEKTAATLVRKIRKSGLHPELATQFITQHAPEAHRSDALQLWQDFVEDAQTTLESDRDYELKDVLSLLRRECNVKAG
ncbi:MAG: hypothetical protein KGN32_08690 [Burkholderiales bacterium]|nr:hypothetical protein [Burkholderiales bacterium]